MADAATPDAAASGAGPLVGIRVLELGTMYAAPTAGRMLRDFGADVVKVEDPASGDYARQWTPQHDGLSLGFARLNAGKRSLGVDLRDERGRALVRTLAASVDVVVESFRPGRLEAWGLGYDELRAENPRLILTRVSGFGQTGPYRARPGFGTVAEVGSGFAFINGWPDTPPTSPPFGFADSIAGISAALGTAMALFRRERTGEGEEVDVALYEPLMFIVGDMLLTYQTSGRVQQRVGNDTGAASPRGIYQAADGHWLAIAASNQGIAKRLFAAMGEPQLIEDPRYSTNAARMARNDELQAMVSAWVGSRSRDEIIKVLEEHEVVVAPVNDARDIVADPHFRERSLAELTGNDVLGRVLIPGPVLHLRSYAGPTYDGVPAIGQHTREILRDLAGTTPAEIDELAAGGVVSSSGHRAAAEPPRSGSVGRAVD